MTNEEALQLRPGNRVVALGSVSSYLSLDDPVWCRIDEGQIYFVESVESIDIGDPLGPLITIHVLNERGQKNGWAARWWDFMPMPSDLSLKDYE